MISNNLVLRTMMNFSLNPNLLFVCQTPTPASSLSEYENEMLKTHNEVRDRYLGWGKTCKIYKIPYNFNLQNLNRSCVIISKLLHILFIFRHGVNPLLWSDKLAARARRWAIKLTVLNKAYPATSIVICTQKDASYGKKSVY